MSVDLNSYHGYLEAEEIAEGMNAANRSARRLWKDAKILLKAERYPSAVALAILSIEESGKISILRRLAVAQDDDEVNDCWRAYRWHTEKNVSWLLPDLVAEGARCLDDFTPLFDENSDHPELLDRVKQLAFYSDCVEGRHWSEPSKVIDEELASSLIPIAGIFVRDEEISEREVEIWIKHLSPVWRTTDGLMKMGVERWYEEMQEEGLAPEGVNKAKKFIWEGIELDE